MPQAAGLTSSGVRRTTELVNQCPPGALATVVQPLPCLDLSVQVPLVHCKGQASVHQPAGNAGLPNPAFNTDVLQPASPASARRLTPSRWA